eukprot:gene10498-21897_t
MRLFRLFISVSLFNLIWGFISQRQLFLPLISYKSKRTLHEKSSPDKSTDETLKQALIEAQQKDYEWLKSVFGEDGIAKLTADLSTKDLSSTPTIKERKYPQTTNKTIASNKIDQDPDRGSRSVEDESAFLSLGYSRDEIFSIRQSVRKVILDRGVKRPRRGLPEEWLKQPLPATDEMLPNTIGNQSDNRKIASEKTRPKTGGERSSSDKSTKDKDLTNMKDRVGTKFSWQGSPPTPSELKDSEIFEKTSKPDRYSTKKKSNTDDEYDNDRGSGYDDYDEGEEDQLSFWPDTEEFKDLLLDESRWRVDVAGPWITPFVRQETKWRYELYKNWLKILQDGVGGGFEVRFDDFDGPSKGPFLKIYDEVYSNDDGSIRNNDNEKEEDWDENPWKSSENNVNNRNDNQLNNDIMGKKSKQKRNNIENNLDFDKEIINENDEMDDDEIDDNINAKEYDDWLKEKFNSGSWTNSFEEERKSEAFINRRRKQTDLSSSLNPSNKNAWFSDDDNDSNRNDNNSADDIGSIDDFDRRKVVSSSQKSSVSKPNEKNNSKRINKSFRLDDTDELHMNTKIFVRWLFGDPSRA